MARKHSSKTFNYGLDFKSIDFRKHPELYQIGKGEQGVLLVEPYKSEILPYWRFRTKLIAEQSSKDIYRLYLKYRKEEDFVGMDMARKFLQMGYTRARRYANHPTGRKYVSNPQKAKTLKEEKSLRSVVLPQHEEWKDGEKAQAARVFYGAYLKVKDDEVYQQLKVKHISKQKNQLK